MPLETKVLGVFAASHKIFLPEKEFQSLYGNRPDAQGNEQLVYVCNDGKFVIKVNDCAYHGTWLEFFDRLALHNFLFPETSYELTGFTTRKGFHGEDRFACIIKQPFVQAERGATFAEVAQDMVQRGFRHLKRNDFYNPELGLIVEDLHDENVFWFMNQLIYIDPVIYTETTDMKLDGKMSYHIYS